MKQQQPQRETMTRSEEGTPWQRLDAAFRKVLAVPKDELLKEEARLKAQKQKRREAKKPH